MVQLGLALVTLCLCTPKICCGIGSQCRGTHSQVAIVDTIFSQELILCFRHQLLPAGLTSVIAMDLIT